MENVVNVIPIDLPGRGSRITEPLLQDINSMVNDIFNQIKKDLYLPYAFYGHSMGTILGCLLTRQIINANLPYPAHLFFTGRKAPSIPENKVLHLLPKEDFIKKLKEYDGTPNEILDNVDIMELFEPVIKADFKAVETYSYKAQQPFDIPVTIMVGIDEGITCEEIMKWQDETTKKISTKQFPGNHFFIFENNKEICSEITETLNNHL